MGVERIKDITRPEYSRSIIKFMIKEAYIVTKPIVFVSVFMYKGTVLVMVFNLN